MYMGTDRLHLRSLLSIKGPAMSNILSGDLRGAAGVPRLTVPLLCLAVGAGWIGYRAWQGYTDRRQSSRQLGRAAPDADPIDGVDPLDAPLSRPPARRAAAERPAVERPITGPMTTDEIEENAWGTAGPHVGTGAGRHRTLG